MTTTAKREKPAPADPAAELRGEWSALLIVWAGRVSPEAMRRPTQQQPRQPAATKGQSPKGKR